MILDYLWKSMFLGGVSASLALAVTLLAGIALRSVSARERKSYFSLQIFVLLGLLSGGFILTALDRQMLAGCFDEFVRLSSSWTITRWVAAGWIAGFIALLSLDVWRGYRALRRVRGYQPVTDRDVLERFARLKVAMGVSGRVELCVADDVLSPFASGFFKHRIVIPRLKLGESTMSSVLAHELAHVRGRDSVLLALELLCRRLLFWNPLSYMFAGIYALSVETAADEAAVEAGVSRSQLASSLVEIAALAVVPSLSPVHVHASRGYRECRTRLQSLARGPVRRSGASLAMLAILAVAPVAVSIAQARTLNHETFNDPKMCVQIKHEQLIESWLRIEPAPPLKCGK